MCVDYLNFIVANKPGHLVSTKDAERIPYRYMKYVRRWQKLKPILPDVRRPQGREYLVPFLLQPAA